MGIVYRALDPVLEREIALKTVDFGSAVDEARREKFLKRFFQEARIAAKLLHPNIVVTHDAATDEATGVPFIAMELVSGGSLHDRLEREGRIPWRDALQLVVPLARALDYAHREGVVHRDIKPANVLLSGDGVPKVADFGIAKLPSSELTHTGAVIGTPFYMSPEQLEADELDGRSDLFSLGALFYTLVAGAPPFRGEDLATITRQILHKNPAPLSEAVSGVPSSLDGVVARALAKKADERYATGAELAEDLERVLKGEPARRPLSLGERTLESMPKKTEAPEAPREEVELELELELVEAPSSSYGFVLALLAASIAVALWIRWQAVSDFVSARVTSAEATLRESREESARRENFAHLAQDHLAAGASLFEHGRFEEAGEAFAEGLRLSREAANGKAEATALLWLGRLAAETGDWSEARSHLESSAGVFEIYADVLGAAEALGERADLERDLGAFESAAALYDVAEKKGLDVSVGRSLLALMQEDVSTAEAGLRAAAEREDEEALLYLASIELALGREEQAQRLWAGASPEEAALFRGYAALALGRVAESKDRFEEAAALCRDSDDRARLASALEGLTGRTDEGTLRTIFLAERRTARSDERRRRLPVAIPPPSE
jgi:tetratricopeptide (TPR) repeat protein